MRRGIPVLALAIVLAACNEAPAPDEHQGHTAAPAATGETATVAPADAWTASGREITYPSSQGEARGYLSEPAAAAEGKTRPGLLVLQEWWGVDDYIRRNADRFAAQGYVVLAPDLYRGRSTTDPAEAHELMRGLPEDRAMADMKAAWAQLAARDDVDATRIGVVGWCLGGGYALALATEEPRLAAVNMNYGRLIEDRTQLSGIQAPILAIFAAGDRGIPVEDVRKFESTLREMEKDVQIHIYDGTGHAFMNPANTEGYAEEATRDAIEKIDAFLRSELAPGT